MWRAIAPPGGAKTWSVEFEEKRTGYHQRVTLDIVPVRQEHLLRLAVERSKKKETKKETEPAFRPGRFGT